MKPEDLAMENTLRPPERNLPDYPPKVITLKDGSKMVVRMAKREEAPLILKAVEPLIKVEDRFYDIVAARIYAEILGWYRYRVRDEFCLVGTIDGELVGQVNSRIEDDDHGVSYHTMCIKPGLRIGAHLFAAKMEYHFEYLKEKVVWIVAESPIGWRRWMEEWGLVERFEKQHELGGAPSFALTSDIYFEKKTDKVLGERPVPQDLLEKSMSLKLPEEYEQKKW